MGCASALDFCVWITARFTSFFQRDELNRVYRIFDVCAEYLRIRRVLIQSKCFTWFRFIAVSVSWEWRNTIVMGFDWWEQLHWPTWYCVEGRLTEFQNRETAVFYTCRNTLSITKQSEYFCRHFNTTSRSRVVWSSALIFAFQTHWLEHNVGLVLIQYSLHSCNGRIYVFDICVRYLHCAIALFERNPTRFDLLLTFIGILMSYLADDVHI